MTVPRAHVFTRQAQPTFHGLRVEPFQAGPIYMGIAAVATVAIAAIVLNLRAGRPGKEAAHKLVRVLEPG